MTEKRYTKRTTFLDKEALKLYVSNGNQWLEVIMTYFNYITNHLLPSWLRQWSCNFKIWSDLMTNNYEAYANPYGESPERECYEWFWSSINIDDTLPKEYLESLYRMMDDIDTKVVKTIPAEDVLKRLNELVNDVDT